MTKKLRVAMVGAGIAQRHLTGFGWNKELFEVPVLCSLDKDPESEFDLSSGLGFSWSPDKYLESEFDLSSGLGFSRPLDKYPESGFDLSSRVAPEEQNLLSKWPRISQATC